MRKPNPIAERIRAKEKAKNHFVRAAAALTEHGDDNALTFALLEASMGLMRLAEADPDGIARDRVIEVVEQKIGERAQARKAEEADGL